MYHHPSYDPRPGETASSRDLEQVRRMLREAREDRHAARLEYDRAPKPAPEEDARWEAAIARVRELETRLAEMTG